MVCWSGCRCASGTVEYVISLWWSGVSFPCDLSDPWLFRFAILSPLYGFLPQLRQSTPTVLQGFAGCFYQGRIFITRQPLFYIGVLKLLQERIA
jgi:hypothetical protein